MRRLLASIALATTLAAPLAALPSDTYAQRSVEQDGLVNVFAADLIDVENVNVAVVAQVVASVCPAVTANVAAIASEVDQSGTAQDIDCPTTGAPITISQNNPGRGRPDSPPGRVSQDGLVNVFAADLIDLRDVNATVAAQAIAAVCPAVTANVAAIVSEVDQSGTAQDIDCTTTGAPITVSQNNPGRGRPDSPPGRVSQDGLVNVFAADLIDIQDVNATVAAQAIAAVCPAITADVAALVSEVDQSGTAQDIECPTTGAPITISQNNPGRGR